MSKNHLNPLIFIFSYQDSVVYFDLKILRLQKRFEYSVFYQTLRHKREKEKKKTHERREPFINYIKVFLGKTDFLISFLFSLFFYTERTINDVKDETPMKLTPRMAMNIFGVGLFNFVESQPFLSLPWGFLCNIIDTPKLKSNKNPKFLRIL